MEAVSSTVYAFILVGMSLEGIEKGKREKRDILVFDFVKRKTHLGPCGCLDGVVKCIKP
jgi:hypothetical protein